MKKLHKNVYLWYTINFFNFSAFAMPIVIIFGIDYLGFSNTQAFVMAFTPFIVSALLEIPTGAFADKFGRVKTYQYGMILTIAGLSGYLFVENFYILILFLSVCGVGSALKSGSLEALVHDSLDKENKDLIYPKLFSNKMIAIFSARVATAGFAGWLFTIDPRLPFLMELIFYTVSFIAGFFLKENRLEQVASKTSGRKHIQETIKLILQDKIFVKFIMLHTTIVLLSEVLFMTFQPYFKSLNIQIDDFGIYYVIVSLISALGAFAIRKIIKIIDPFAILMIMMMLTLTSAFTLLLRMPELMYLAVIPLAFSFGLSRTLMSTTTQRKISSKHQATALSIVSMAGTLAFGLGALVVGQMLDNISLATVNITLAVLYSIALLPFILSVKRRRIVLPKQPKVDQA